VVREEPTRYLNSQPFVYGQTFDPDEDWVVKTENDDEVGIQEYFDLVNYYRDDSCGDPSNLVDDMRLSKKDPDGELGRMGSKYKRCCTDFLSKSSPYCRQLHRNISGLKDYVCSVKNIPDVVINNYGNVDADRTLRNYGMKNKLCCVEPIGVESKDRFCKKLRRKYDDVYIERSLSRTKSEFTRKKKWWGR
jgi:hypothetical protein